MITAAIVALVAAALYALYRIADARSKAFIALERKRAVEEAWKAAIQATADYKYSKSNITNGRLAWMREAAKAHGIDLSQPTNEPYYKRDHVHCFNQGGESACGIKGEHPCCLCKEPVPTSDKE
jgi:hypothetical protein